MAESVKKKDGGTKKIVQIETRTFVNNETGVVTQEENSQILRLPQEPPFIKLYLADISKIYDLPQGPHSLMYYLVRKMNWDGEISLTAHGRQTIANAINVKVHSLNNYLTVLIDKGVIRRIGRGEYEMNPNLFAKGDWKDILRRRAEFEMTVTYTKDGERIVSGKVIPLVENDENMF